MWFREIRKVGYIKDGYFNIILWMNFLSSLTIENWEYWLAKSRRVKISFWLNLLKNMKRKKKLFKMRPNKETKQYFSQNGNYVYDLCKSWKDMLQHDKYK